MKDINNIGLKNEDIEILMSDMLECPMFKHGTFRPTHCYVSRGGGA